MQACYFSLYQSPVHMGSFLFVSAPKNRLFVLICCSAIKPNSPQVVLYSIDLKLCYTPLKLFLRRPGHADLWKRPIPLMCKKASVPLSVSWRRSRSAKLFKSARRWSCCCCREDVVDIMEICLKNASVACDPMWYSPLIPIEKPSRHCLSGKCGDEERACEFDGKKAKHACHLHGVLLQRHHKIIELNQDNNQALLNCKEKAFTRGVDGDGDKQDWLPCLPFAGKELMTFWQSHPSYWQPVTSALSPQKACLTGILFGLFFNKCVCK